MQAGVFPSLHQSRDDDAGRLTISSDHCIMGKEALNRMNRFCLADFGVKRDSSALQTDAVQRVFDLCRASGGTVVVPAGSYHTGSLRLWSGMTLHLEKGAELFGSGECTDYQVYDVPQGIALHTDMEMIPQYYHGRPWPEYRRALLSAYGEENITIEGEEGSVIDGRDCYDADGEEGFRGPHGIFLSNCRNVTLRGYTIRNTGNFMHQLDTCRRVRMEHVTCLAGHDGIHLHCCEDIVIRDCVFRTGDDCIAGINIRSLLVRDCELNTSCDLFRIGGVHIAVQNCRMTGPGYYPHRMTVVRGKNDVLPREAGRHNLEYVLNYFASTSFPDSEPSHDIVFRDCTVENADRFLVYHADCGTLQSGTHLTGLTLENVKFSGLAAPSDVSASAAEPLTVILKNVCCSFREGAAGSALFDGRDPNTKIVMEPAQSREK